MMPRKSCVTTLTMTLAMITTTTQCTMVTSTRTVTMSVLSMMTHHDDGDDNLDQALVRDSVDKMHNFVT